MNGFGVHMTSLTVTSKFRQNGRYAIISIKILNSKSCYQFGGIVKKILIVEDHADIRRLIRLTLEFDDYEMREAEDGASGLAAAALFEPDLVLLDVMMPGPRNGYDICRILKAQDNPPQVVLLTAKARSEDEALGLAAGADAYITKPFSPLQLAETLETLLK